MSKKTVITAREAEAIIARGGGLASLPPGSIVTPMARDLLKSAPAGNPTAPAASAEPGLPDYIYRWENEPQPATPEEMARFFVSQPIEKLKARMCDMGRRMWEKGYVDGNGGNLVIRVGANLFLCTQTLISKGFMTPETIAMVDGEGRQLAGQFKRTSEVLTHLAIYRAQPAARATCHAHPVHATAFAVARVQPPTCMIPEAEVFLGQIGLAEYQTPGTPANAEAVGAVAKDHHAILMVNHGVITWGDHIEDAYWKMENVDSYCQTLWIAMHLTPNLSTITGGQARELIALRKKLGMSDKREGWKECELCDNSEWPRGVICEVPAPASQAPAGLPPGASSPYHAEAEALVKQIADQIMKRLGSA